MDRRESSPTLFLSAAALAALAILAIGGLFGLPEGNERKFFLTWYLFFDQDRFLLLLCGLTLGLSAYLCQRTRFDAPELLSSGSSVVVALASVIVCFVGSHLIFGATPVSYDEVMAEFDRRIFQSGHLAAIVQPEYRALLPGLVRTFWLDIPGHAAWISSYWPGNAALRALAGTFIGEIWTGPILAGVTLLATADVAYSLFRPDRTVRATALLMLALSPQFLLMAMTPYAMSAHLALNMVWLALFLRDRPGTHLAAIAVSILATGLHQLVFHPLFAAPFLLWRLREGRIRLVLVYGLAFALILLAWMQYPAYLRAAYGFTVITGSAVQGTAISGGLAEFISRWTGILGGGEDSASGHAAFAPLTFFNLTRFMVWQSPLVIPLVIAGLFYLRGERPVIIAMTAGVGLTLLFMVLVLPYQGRGWGYRYMHGQLGVMALLAGHTLRRLSFFAPASWARGFLLATGLGALVTLPTTAVLAAHFTAPIARGMALIHAAKADYVVIDENGLPFSSDLVRNDPDLRNRPLMVHLAVLPKDLVSQLCAGGKRVMVFDRRSGTAIGFLATEGGAKLADPAPTDNRRALEAACAPERLMP